MITQKSYEEVEKEVMKNLYVLSETLSERLKDFDFESSVLQWHGVEGVDEEERITKLILPCAQLKGSIPSEMGQLTALEDLYFSNNHLTDRDNFKAFMIGKVPGCLVL